MKAVGYRRALPVDESEALLDIVILEPAFEAHDLLVEVKAVSVNPVDTTVRRSTEPTGGAPKVLGWDAAGIVRAVGSDVTLFKPGDRVWYAGSILRPGTNSELHVVDERIVGMMPLSLTFAEAAALPLTAITAWELLFDRLQVENDVVPDGNQLLVIGAAGGVGSILIQLARKLTKLTIVGTASNAQSEAWVRELGAHHVIDYRKPIVDELQRIDIATVGYIAGLTHTETHFGQMTEAVAPEGRIGIIDDPKRLDVTGLKSKSASLHWEFMFTRSMYGTADMIQQYNILNRVGKLVDDGTIKTTLTQNFGTINADNLRRAHAVIESNRSRGKIVLEGF